VLSVLKRRHNALHILIHPSEVQGANAAAQISEGIDYLSTQTDVDVILIARGGGSLEDLWPFNDERVARAIVRSLKPVISAVGHEVDFTIADFVSDLRAPTPSAAAEIVIQSKDVLSQRVVQLENRLHGSIRYRLSTLRHFLASKVGSRGFAVAEAQVRRLAQRIDDLGFRLLQFGRPGTLTQSSEHRVEMSEQRLIHAMEQTIRKSQQSFSRVAGTMDALSPLAVLDRGYAVCQTPDGRVVRDADAVDVNSAVRVRLSRGSLIALVTSRE
jgi:exodeoxyribonuclease VII large subunit